MATLLDGSATIHDRELGALQHAVQFYEHDAFLVDAVSRFVEEGLVGGESVVIIATGEHQNALAEQLHARGVNQVAAVTAGQLIALDAAEILSQIMVDGQPNEARFTHIVGSALSRASISRRQRIRAFGEMVAILWSEGRTDAAVRLEELWSDLGRKVSFSLLCAYPIDGFRNSEAATFLRICGEHSSIIPAESYTTLTADHERTRAIAHLQQNALALEAERAARAQAERCHREELEAFFVNAPIGIHCVGPDGIILSANGAEVALLGYEIDDYVGHHIAEFHVDRDGIEDMLGRLLRGESIRGHEARLRCKDGSIKHVLIDSNGFWLDGEFIHSRCFTRDNSEQRRRQAESAQLSAIVESSDDAIVSKTFDGVVTSWNRGAERLFGYTADEMVGQPISRIIPTDRRDDFFLILDTMRRGERVEHFETERVSKDGRRVQVSLSVSPIRDADGRVVGAAKIARDVTERKRAEAERAKLLKTAERARAEAEAASAAKDEFLAMLGHELRNPLSAVRNAIVAAQLDETRREWALGIARRQTEQLGRLVDDLLDVARITKGRIALRKERVYLTEVIDRALETARPGIDEHGHALTVSLPPEELGVEGDLSRLEQVVVNLLNNAAKYTPRGGRIVLSAEREGDEAVVRVSDNGVGISADLLSRIFELFAQGERGLDRAQGGLGIGLTVVKSLVELHGGRVEAHSGGPGEGAEVVVRLPALPAPVASSLPAPAPSPAPRSEVPARVLLVEDNADAAQSLVMLLELLGHDVRAVRDGSAALAAVAEQVPGVIVADIGLPGMDGYELASRIRQRSDCADVLLIALTGYGLDADRRKSLAAGFHHHLVKPIDPSALLRLFANLRTRGSKAGEKPSLLH